MSSLLEDLDESIAKDQGDAVNNLSRSSTAKRIPGQNTLLQDVLNSIGQDNDPNIDTETGLQDNYLRMKMGFTEGNITEDEDARLKVLTDAGLQASREKDGRLVYINPKTRKKTWVDESGMTLRDMSDLVGTLPEMIGDAGMQGAAFYLTKDPIVAASAGALGAAGGNVLKKKIGKYAFGIEEKTDMVGDATMSAAASLGGSALFGGANKLLSPGKNVVKPGAFEADELLKTKDANLTAAQILEPKGLVGEGVDFIQNLVEGAWFGGPIITRSKQEQKRAFSSLLDDIVNRLGNHMSPDEIGIVVNKALNGKQDFLHEEILPPMFRKVDSYFTKVKPETDTARKYVTKYLDKYKYTETTTREVASDIVSASGTPFKKTVTETETKEMMKALRNPSVRNIFENVKNLPDNMTFEQAAGIRSDLLKLVRDGKQTGVIGDDSARVLKGLAKEFDTIMEIAAKKGSPEGYKVWRSVNEVYAQVRETFGDDFVKAIFKKNPELLVDSIVTTRNITNMRKIKKILGETDKGAWNRMGSMYLSKTLQGLRFDDVTKTSAAKQLYHKLYTQMGEKSLKMIYDDPAIYKGLKSVVDAAVLAEEKGLSGNASIAIKLTQFGAVAQLLGGDESTGDKIGAAGIILGPVALATLMTSPQGVKWLTKGLLQSSKAQGVETALKSIVTFVTKKQLEHEGGAGRSFGDRPATTRIPEQDNDRSRMSPFNY